MRNIGEHESRGKEAQTQIRERDLILSLFRSLTTSLMGFILHLTLGIAVSFALVRGGDIVSSLSGLTSFLGLTSATLWSLGSSKVIDATECGAYVAQNIHETADSIVAELVFAGNYCYAPGFDSSGSSSIIERLTLKVVVEEGPFFIHSSYHYIYVTPHLLLFTSPHRDI